MLISILLVLALFVPTQGEDAKAAGQIRGVLIDATGAELPGGLVRVFQTPSNSLVTRVRTEPAGWFQVGGLQAGSYILVAWVQGFSARRSPVVIVDRQTTDLGKIQLDVGSCDAPGVMCDDFGLGPPDTVLSRGYVELKLSCGVDLRSNRVSCPDAPGPEKAAAVDLRFTREEAGVYLTSVNGSTLSRPNQQRGDEFRIRVDGMGPGDDIWVRTRKGLQSHTFFVDDVEPTSQSVRAWHITRKR